MPVVMVVMVIMGLLFMGYGRGKRTPRIGAAAIAIAIGLSDLVARVG
jgi:hypothetical protein